jgi:hypothetical protein
MAAFYKMIVKIRANKNAINKVSLRGVKRQGNLVAYWERLLRLRAVMHFGVQACARWSLEMTMKKQLVRLL